jgi:phosphohistidine phosphatase
MTRRLILVRHAKSSWAVEGMDDHDRPLNPRGRRSAAAIGRWLSDKGYLPELVLSSDSARTRETWQRLAEEWPRDERPASPHVQFTSELYLADPHTLLSLLQGLGSETTVLVLAHNPGIAEAAMQLAIAIPEQAQFSRYPTGATAVFDIDIDDWRSLGWRTAVLRDFVVPRELPES